MSDFDIAIIGAGIAGASLAAELSAHCSVVLVEAESQPGYHSTGRSAAFWDESYGGPDVQPLTTASGPFLANPPADFHDGPLMHPRGALHLGTETDRARATNMLADFQTSGVRIEEVGRTEVENYVPGLRADWTHGLWEPDCCDIDVSGLHGAYLKAAKRNRVILHCNAPFRKAVWRGGRWRIEAGSLTITADVVVNAAGAWADDVAKIAGLNAIGIQPYRRTIAQLTIDPAVPANLPLVIGPHSPRQRFTSAQRLELGIAKVKALWWRPALALQGDGAGVARQAIEIGAMKTGKSLQLVQRPDRIKGLRIQLHRGVCRVATGAARGIFFQLGGVRRTVGAQKELG